MNDDIRQQYATTQNLLARGSFQAKYATIGWFGWLTDRMGLETGSNVLDVGCGPAWFWQAEAERLPHGLRLSLIDTSPGMIKEAKANIAASNRFKVAGIEVADAVALPYPDKSFDVVLLLHVLYHVNDPSAALHEAYRVLHPGGRVFVSTNRRDSMNELHVLGTQVFGGEPVDPGAARFSLDDAERVVEAVFGTAQRHDLTDVMACTEPDDAIAFLLSMPPGYAASADQRRRLCELIHKVAKQTDGVLRSTRRNGLVVGLKPGSFLGTSSASVEQS